MTKDTVCGCCHVTTGAVVIGVVQAVIVVMLLSTSGILLDRSKDWKFDYGTSDQTTMIPSDDQSFDEWRGNLTWLNEVGLVSFLDIHLAHHAAFYSLWLIFLALYAFAFKSHRPVLVLPNLIMQLIAVVLMMILAGVLIAKLVLLTSAYGRFQGAGFDTDSMRMRYTFYSILLGLLVIGWVAEIVFIWIGYIFYRFLRDTQHTVHPQSSRPQAAATIHRSQDPQLFTASIEPSPNYPKNEINP